MKIIILIFLFPLVSLGQTTYRGLVKDLKNNTAIPFATVGLMQENIGTNSYENGIFELKSAKSIPEDTLIISCLGYKVFKIKVTALDTSQIEILLSEKSFNLKEIVVTNNKKLKSEILNDFDTSSYSYEGTGDATRDFMYIFQIAQHYRAQSSNCQLMKVKICDGSIFFGRAGFYRLRIYDMDPQTKAPSNDLCNRVIEVRTKLKRSGIYSINLEKYKIIIPDKDFFIAVEWLNVPLNYYKNKESKFVWIVPTIGWTAKTDQSLESWQLSYNYSWLSRPQKTMLISATVKY